MGIKGLSGEHFLIILILAVLVSAPFLVSDYLQAIMLFWFYYTTLAVSWNMLAGYSGLVSLGQQMFVAIGGYTLAIASIYFSLPIHLSILLGGAVSAVLSLGLGVILLRMRGIYFALGTMVLAEAFRFWFNNWQYVKAGSGIFISTAYNVTLTQAYWGGVIIAFTSIFATRLIVNSKFGLALRAIRDDYVSASTSGVNITFTKIAIFTLSAFFTGVGGAAFYLYQVYINPSTAFSFALVLKMMLAVVIGGLGTIEGPVVGAAITVILDHFLANFPGVSLLLEGAIGLVIILLIRRGIIGSLKKTVRYQTLIERLSG
jgi:branched-chain amino acid transport system permease protein